MDNAKFINYGEIFYRIENIITYLFLLIYLFIAIVYIMSKVDNPLVIVFLSILSPLPMIIPIYYFISFIVLILLIVFFKDTKEDFKYLRRFGKDYKGEEINIIKKIRLIKIMRFPFYESLFIPRYREHPVLKKIYYHRIIVYLVILGYIALFIPSIIVNYWEGRIFDIISLIYIYTLRILVRGVSIPIFIKLTKISFKEILKFRDIAITIKEYEKDKKVIKTKDTIFLFVKDL